MSFEGSMPPLTERQRLVLSIITQAVGRGQPFPSLREIALKAGIAHKSGVSGHLRALERKGYIRKRDQRVSDFHLSSKNAGADAEAFPVAATIAAGCPQEVFEGGDASVRFNPSYFGGGDLRAVHISGNSMNGDAIEDGDVALIRVAQDHAADDILAIRVAQDAVTLKRLRVRGAEADLISSNPAHPIRTVATEDIAIIGKLVGIVRRHTS